MPFVGDVWFFFCDTGGDNLASQKKKEKKTVTNPQPDSRQTTSGISICRFDVPFFDVRNKHVMTLVCGYTAN